MVKLVWLAGFGMLLGACGDNAPGFDYPRDDTLRLGDLQGRGTHNSYHIAPDPFQLNEWNYTHAPLDDQLAAGVRQFELDININPFDDRFEVFHILRVDDATTCFLFVDCLRDMKRWSDANRGHHPFVVMVEIKDGFLADSVEAFFATFERELLSVWPEDRLVTPALVRGDYGSLREALADRGWPTLGELRGRALFFLLDRGGFRDFYTHDGTSLEGRLAFAVSDIDAPYAAITNIDDPVSRGADIETAVRAGMLIRTRVDDHDDVGAIIDQFRVDAALQSGAHFLSSDVREFEIPGGSPSRCNPITAPADCVASEIEDPAFID